MRVMTKERIAKYPEALFGLIGHPIDTHIFYYSKDFIEEYIFYEDRVRVIGKGTSTVNGDGELQIAGEITGEQDYETDFSRSNFGNVSLHYMEPCHCYQVFSDTHPYLFQFSFNDRGMAVWFRDIVSNWARGKAYEYIHSNFLSRVPLSTRRMRVVPPKSN